MSRLPEPLRSLVESGDAARLRRDAGIRQATMAAALGCARSQVSVYERGLRSPGPSRAVSWLRILNGLAWHLTIPEEERTGPETAPHDYL